MNVTTLTIQPYEDSFLLKGSHTKNIKEDLKELGGVWFVKAGAWKFSSKEDLVEYLDNNDLSYEESDESFSVKKELVLHLYGKNCLLLKGDSKALLSKLKTIGVWNTPLQGWLFSVSRKGELKSILKGTSYIEGEPLKKKAVNATMKIISKEYDEETLRFIELSGEGTFRVRKELATIGHFDKEAKAWHIPVEERKRLISILKENDINVE